MDKKYIKLDDTEIEDHKFQYESSISTNDINKIVAPNKFPFSKMILVKSFSKILNVSLVTKLLKKSDLYSYSVRRQLL